MEQTGVVSQESSNKSDGINEEPPKALSVKNLTKIFDKNGKSVVAVDGVSFNVRQGEFVSVLGPSGSGKSTILRMIGGFETPTNGDVKISGENINNKPPFQRNVNLVFQDLALFPHMSVEKNIEYGLKQKDIKKGDRKEKVTEVLDIVQLSGYSDRSIDELSGGEKQRVALARAIVNRPQIVLFDEPLASLDRKLRQHMRFELQRIQSETGLTFLYVTHDQDVALSISDRLIILKEGQIEQNAPTAECYEKPNTKFTANFLGDMNFFHIDKMTEKMSEPELANLCDLNINLIPDEAQIGIRPHQITPRDEQSDDKVHLGAIVRNKIYNGDSTMYILKSNFGELSVKSSNEFEINESVKVSWSSQAVHVFHDGLRLSPEEDNVN